MALTIKGSAFFFGTAADADAASFDHYFAWLNDVGPDVQWPYLPREEEPEVKRSLYCGLDETHIYGVFLSARNAEFQHFIKREGNRVIVEARSTEGDPPVEMNFFCIRRDCNKGIFSHYMGSYRFQHFLHDLWITYKEFVKLRSEEHLANLHEERYKRDVAASYSLYGRCQGSPLYTPGSFDDLLDRLSTVCEVRATSYSVEGPEDQPVSGSLKSVHRVYRLEEMHADAGLKRWLKQLRLSSSRLLKSGKTVHSGSVYGADQSGVDFAVSFESTMMDYLEFDYDALGTFEVDRIKQHTLVRAMLDQMNNNLLFAPTEED